MYEGKKESVRQRNERKDSISRRLIDSNIANKKYLKHLNNDRNFDLGNYNRGREWYKLYHSLDNASDVLKNDLSFLKGFESGRLASFREGIIWFKNVGNLDDVASEYIDDKAFYDGYLYAENASKNKPLRR